MSRKFATSIDMLGNEVLNFRVQMLAADPALTEARMWYNTTDDMLRYYNGTTVIDLGGGGATAAEDVSVDDTGWINISGPDVQAALDATDTNINALYTALTGKAPTNNPTFTGAVDMTGATVSVPTAAPGDNDSSAASTAFVAAAIAALIGAAPGTLDTLNELADALGDDPNFATTIATSLGLKAGKFTQVIVGGSTAEVITHNLGTRSVVVSVHDVTTFDEVEVDVQKTSVNTITLGFAVAPAAGAYRVTVIG